MGSATNIHEIVATEDFDFVSKTEGINDAKARILSTMEIKNEPNDSHESFEEDYSFSVKAESEEINPPKIEFTSEQPSVESRDEDVSIKTFESVFLRESPLAHDSQCCDVCLGEYEDFCHKCSMILRILDNVVQSGTPGRAKKTLPQTFFEIRESNGTGVFALKPIPIGVTLGPFIGVDRSEVGVGFRYKIINGKLSCSASEDHSNWLRYINYSDNHNYANLVIIQCRGFLYYRTHAQIYKNTELLVHFGNEVYGDYYMPLELERLEEVFPCVPCCLGFCTKFFLQKHRKNCPYRSESSKTAKKRYYCDTCCKWFIYSGTGSANGHSHKHSALFLKKRKARTYKTLPIKCDKCDVHPKSAQDQSNQKFKCSMCGKTCKNQQSLVRHCVVIHNKKLACDICYAILENKNARRKPIATPPKPIQKLYKCSYCEQMTTERRCDFVQHMIHKYDKVA